MDFLQHIKQPNQDPAVGKLLIAEPFMTDHNFTRKVVLLCDMNTEGSVGFILNHPTSYHLGDVLPTLGAEGWSLNNGGPVQMDCLHMLHRLPGVLGGHEILPGIFWGGSFDTLQEMAAAQNPHTKDVKLFLGYAGWTAGQLEKEMQEGSWLVSEGSSGLLFDTDATHVWEKAIRSLGKDYSYLANMPLNPQLN
ncbi:YqgE/AlgH family protein [Chitinophagaceae bacterium MMS25-I14]